MSPTQDFLTWLTTHGATFPYVKPRLAESNKGYGLFLTSIPLDDDSTEPDPLLTLPGRLWFTRGNILRRAFRDAEHGDNELLTWLDTVRRYELRREGIEDHTSSSPDPNRFNVSHRGALTTCMLHARRRPESFWYAYVQMLPLETVDTPVLWYVEKILERQGLFTSEDDPASSSESEIVSDDTGESPLDLLACTEVGRASRAKAEKLFEDHQMLTTGSDENEEGQHCLSPKDLISSMEYARADALVGSRALSFNGVEREFSIRNPTRSDDGEHGATQDEEDLWTDDFDDTTNPDEKHLVMLPLLDLCNHSSRPNARWRVHPQKNQVDLVLTVPLASVSVSDEISISYGSRPTSEFLFLYGFVPELDLGPNLFESITMPVPIDFLWAGSEEEDGTENSHALVVAKMEYMKSVGLPPRIKILSDFETRVESRAAISQETLKDGLSLDSRRTLWLCSVNLDDGIIPSSTPDHHLSVLVPESSPKPLSTLPDLDDFVRTHALYPLFRLRSVSFLNSIIDSESESLRRLLAASLASLTDHRKNLIWSYATGIVEFLDRARKRCLRAVETLMSDETVVAYLRETEMEG